MSAAAVTIASQAARKSLLLAVHILANGVEFKVVAVRASKAKSKGVGPSRVFIFVIDDECPSVIYHADRDELWPIAWIFWTLIPFLYPYRFMWNISEHTACFIIVINIE